MGIKPQNPSEPGKNSKAEAQSGAKPGSARKGQEISSSLGEKMLW